MRRAASILLAAAAMLAAQNAPEPAGVAGTVVNSLTGEPIERAHLSLHCQESPQAYGALTNEKGTFAIAKLPTGNCWVTAQRVGYLAGNQSFSLASGQQLGDVKVKLVPAGVIAGRVLDSAGDPVRGAVVSVWLPQGNSRNASTDDKGRFRLGELPAGHYRVKAKPETMPFPPEVRGDGSMGTYDAGTWYPDSLNKKAAQPVEVKPGAEVDGVEIHLVRIPVGSVSGRVTGGPVGTNNVEVSDQTQGVSTRVRPDGTFIIWRLDPGKYDLVAETGDGSGELRSAPLEVEVGTANVEHLELRMIPPFSIDAQIRFDEEQVQAGQPTRPRRQAQLLKDNRTGREAAEIASDDSFSMRNVQPDRYHLSILGYSGFVKSIRAGDRETEGDVLDLRNGSPGPITVTLSSNYATISGTVSDSNGPAAGAWVMLEQPGQTVSRSLQSDAGGNYKFQGIAPGTYRIVALADRSQDTEDLDEIADTIEVHSGDRIAKDLKRR